MFNHVAQRKLVDAVAKQGLVIAAHHAVIMVTIDPAFTQTKRGRRQAQQAQVRVHLFQVRQDLLILAVVVIADAVTLVDNQQRKFAAKQIQIAGHRLHAAKHHLAVALFTL